MMIWALGTDNGILRVNCPASMALLAMAGLLLVGCGGGIDGYDGVETGDDVTRVERSWVKEDEFQQDLSLYATLEQVIIFDLEPASSGDDSPLLRNSVRFTVSDTQRVRFCIPAQDDHLRTLELANKQGDTVLHQERGSNCSVVELGAGRYVLHLFHDATTVDVPGETAFFRWSNPPRVVQDSIAAPAWDFFTFKAPNKKYVGLANPESNPGAVAAISDTVTPATVFLKGNLGVLASPKCQPGSLSLAPFSATPVAGLGWFPSTTDSNLFPDDELLAMQIEANAAAATSACASARKNTFGACVVSFLITDQGNYDINLKSQDACIHTDTLPIIVDAFDVLKIASQAATPTKFTVDYTGYLCEDNGQPGDCSQDDDLKLQTGEVAVFSECNFKGPAIVFAADVPDFSVYDDAPTDPAGGFVYGVKDNAMGSVMLGPDTLVELWENPGGPDGNTVLGVPENLACLYGTPLLEKVSQLKIAKTVKQYIADTGGCDNCNLTDVDLSDADLSGKSFVNTIFAGANLTGTKFNSAVLRQTAFGGTSELDKADFTDAKLECTDFHNLNLTNTWFGNNTFTTDVSSCRLNLTSAEFTYGTFGSSNWRYFTMTGSKVDKVPDTLSSYSAPLDLSGAELGGVTWLQGKALDYANLGCFKGSVVIKDGEVVCPNSGSRVCTTLTGTSLNNASLTYACLDSANLQGVNLEYANLEAADFTGAVMTAVKLDGAFLRDAILKNANLTGASMPHVSFYKVNNGANATGATMTNANLTGAYLYRASFSDAILHGTKWNSAMLVQVDFSGADLSVDSSGFTSTFNSAYMQGAIFSGSSVVTGVNFTNTYWDLGGTGDTNQGTLNYLLPSGNIVFKGSAKFVNTDVTDQCVQASYPFCTSCPSGPPASTNDTVTCPHGASGPCTLEDWNNPAVPFSSQSQAAKKPDYPGTCTEDTINFYWD